MWLLISIRDLSERRDVLSVATRKGRTGEPCFERRARELAVENDLASFVETNGMERILAEVDAGDSDPAVCCI